MRQPSGRILVAVLCALLTGCATSALEMAPDWPDRPWTPATNASGEIIPEAKASPEESSKATYVLPANSELADVPAPLALDRGRTYSLAELIDIAQSNNPLDSHRLEQCARSRAGGGHCKKHLSAKAYSRGYRRIPNAPKPN